MVTKRRAVRIVRDRNGVFSCAVHEIFRLFGVVFRVDRWLGPGGGTLGITSVIRIEPRLEALLRQLTTMRLGR